MDRVPDDVGYWRTSPPGGRRAGAATAFPNSTCARCATPRGARTEGRPVFDEAAYVRVLVPGDRNSVVDRPCGGRRPRALAQPVGRLRGQARAPRRHADRALALPHGGPRGRAQGGGES